MALLGFGIALILVGAVAAGLWRRYDEWPGLGLVALGLVLVVVAVVRQPGFGAEPSVATTPTPTAASPSVHPAGRPSGRPASARVTAVCRDGRPSYSTTVRGACARDGGVRRWVHRPAA